MFPYLGAETAQENQDDNPRARDIKQKKQSGKKKEIRTRRKSKKGLYREPREEVT